MTPSASPAVSFAALTVAPSFSSWSTCDLDDWCTTLENFFPGNRYLIPLLSAELNRRWPAMPPVVFDPMLDALIPF